MMGVAKVGTWNTSQKLPRHYLQALFIESLQALRGGMPFGLSDLGEFFPVLIHPVRKRRLPQMP
jgi:hypothetical protein